uniref:hypothetical protein n=1 Tax=Streptomyces sp. CA-141956 TaxID=3240051 RepID=UPI003F4974BB
MDAGRLRRIQAAAADRLPSLDTRTPLPGHAIRRSDTLDAQPVAEHIRALQLRYDDRASTAFIAKVAGVNARPTPPPWSTTSGTGGAGSNEHRATGSGRA